MKKNKHSFPTNKVDITYEPEDDVLNIWLSKKPYVHGEYDDGVVTHYSKEGEPVYIEVLFASRFFKDQHRKFSEKTEKIISSTPILHKIR